MKGVISKNMYTLNINLSQKSYPIYIEKEITHNIGKKIKKIYKNNKIAIITDKNVDKLYGRQIESNLNKENYLTTKIVIEPGEKSKSLEVLHEVYNKLLDFKISRSDLIIAFGGGVVGDLGGLAAATFLRGIQFIQVPTSLLAQIDSSVGGKVAVNLKRGKNLVGNFYHPMAVFIDPKLLETLSEKYFSDGMAELIKYGAIKDSELLQTLWEYDKKELFHNIEEVIYNCCNIKKQVVEEDEKDKGRRMLLNFGHTIGHGIERYFNYNKYTHGEAVAIGMYIITRNSEAQGITKKNTTDFIKKLLIKYELPYEIPSVPNEDLIDIIKLDKKVDRDNINIVLLKEIGNGFIKKISIKDIGEYLKYR